MTTVEPSNELDVRLAHPHEIRATAEVARAALLMPPLTDEIWADGVASWTEGYIATAAWDGDRCVGNVGSIDFRMLLPGGTWVPSAGITRVGVLPTHTRRGALTRMMRQLLAHERANGKVLAALLASETTIYGRYGFGHATDESDLRIDVPRVGGVRGAGPGTFRLLTREETVGTVTEIYERVAHRPGTLTRPAWMIARRFENITKADQAAHVVVHTSPDGVDDGYAHYSVKWSDESGVDHLGQMDVSEIVASGPDVELALWNYLCSVSLIRRITFERAPANCVVRAAARDARAVRVNGVWDELFVRPLDVHACLTARAYGSATQPVTIAIDDPMFIENCGTWVISADGVHRVDASHHEPDITASVQALGSTLLGGMSWATQGAIGAARGSTEALTRADALFGQHPAPFCGTFF